MISIIAAVAKNNCIGVKNKLPWHIPEDLRHFKEITIGKPVLMGRKTYESILTSLGKPLPERKNLVLTSDKDYTASVDTEIFFDLSDVLKKYKDQDLFVIGGAKIWEQVLPIADKLYITHIYQQYDGDAFFPQVDWSQWKKTSSKKHDKFEFAEYEK